MIRRLLPGGGIPTLAFVLLAAVPSGDARSAPAQRKAAAATPTAVPTAIPKAPADLFLNAGGVLTMDGTSRILSESTIVIVDGIIAAITSADEARARFVPKAEIERRGAVVMPGFVNTHTHAAMSLLRGLADDMKLDDWLKQKIFPAEAKNVTPDFVKVGTELACLEMVRSGTTTFADMYYYESDVAEAVARIGMRGVLGETWLDFPAPGHKDLEESKAVTRRFLEKWKGHPLITAAVAPHAPYTCSKETLLAAKALADEFRAPLLIHVSETKKEQDDIRARYGSSPTRWLDSIGFLGKNVVFAHGVWLDEEDMKTCAARGVSVSHNPESNMKLASGAAPVTRMRELGVAVGLGTDGVAGSNNDLEMFEAMDFAGKLAKVTTLDPTALPARELLRMATIEGARALKMEDRIGSVEVGKAADLIAVELDAPRTRPVYDIASTLVYSAKGSDVTLTMVAGKILWDARRGADPWPTIDVGPLTKKIVDYRNQVRKSLQPEPAATRPDAKGN